MKQSKKKRSRVSKIGSAEKDRAKIADDKEQMMLKQLLDAFGTVSVDEEANGKAAEVLTKTAAPESDQITTSSSSSGNYDVGSSSSSSVSEVFYDPNNFLDGFKPKSKPKMKKVIAAAGTVSTLLGKDYVRSIPKKGSSKLKGFHEEKCCKEEAEQFLCSMLGDDCELSLAVVSDVLCHCGYNIDKGGGSLFFQNACHLNDRGLSRAVGVVLFPLLALDVLLEMSASSRDQASDYLEAASREYEQLESNSSLSDITAETTDNMWMTGNLFRNLSNVPESNENRHLNEMGDLDFELPQKVLESLFKMPTPKTAELEPNTMNWRNIAKKMTALGQRSEPGGSEQLQLINGKRDEYNVLRESAQVHWSSMKSYYQKAVTAFTNGDKNYASYLSDQGRSQNKMAREADEKASQNIFTARNKTIENMVTIDLHGQHIKQAMKLLKLHLLFGAYVRSVRSFRVITGCGSHGVGKSKLKTSVVNLLQKEGIAWSEENQGTLLIRLDGQTDFSFLDNGSDSD
ncbi:hypothetical protein CASFOL_039588 [Castilleja foliolosa]|uniref:Smr domain-containing protein n=1 Tax=Castilleja foliolosa TaxID=1961234 RepID=A0ABD3BFN0_9LAMI